MNRTANICENRRERASAGDRPKHGGGTARRSGALSAAGRPSPSSGLVLPPCLGRSLGEARTVPAVADRGVRPAAGASSGVLDAHRQVEPVESMKDSPGARGLPQRSRAIGAVAQDRHLRVRRHAETAQHAVQLRVLLVCFTGHATQFAKPNCTASEPPMA